MIAKRLERDLDLHGSTRVVITRGGDDFGTEKLGDKHLVGSLIVSEAHSAALFGDCRTAKNRANEILLSTEDADFLADAAFVGRERIFDFSNDCLRYAINFSRLK